MAEKLYVFLLEADNSIAEEKIINKPEAYVQLIKALKDNIIKLPREKKDFSLFYFCPNSDNIYEEKSINRSSDYKTMNDTLLIRVNETAGNPKSPLSLTYDQLTQDKKKIIDERYVCKICSDFIEEKPLFCPECQKIFHQKCLENWEEKSKKNKNDFSCPFCKNEIPLNEWKQKLYHDENIKNDIKIMNQIMIYDLINLINERKIKMLQNELKSKDEQLNKEPDIFLNILKQINDITPLMKKIMGKNSLEIIKKFKELQRYILEFSKYNNEIEISYSTTKEGLENIFGEEFKENNKNNIDLMINGEKSPLVSQCKLKKGTNSIKLIIKNDLNNLEHMFHGCDSLAKIEELKYLDTRKVTNYSYMLYGCTLLKNIKPLEQWNISKGINFTNMLSSSTLFNELKTFKNWKSVLSMTNSANIFNENKKASMDEGISQGIFSSIINEQCKKIAIKADF
jgi:hypothetical protein